MMFVSFLEELHRVLPVGTTNVQSILPFEANDGFAFNGGMTGDTGTLTGTLSSHDLLPLAPCLVEPTV